MMLRCGVLAADADEAAAIDPGPATPGGDNGGHE